MDVALFIPHGHCHHPDLAEIKVHVVLMVVRGDPAHPHAARLLASEDPHRVIVLKRQRGPRVSQEDMGRALPWHSKLFLGSQCPLEVQQVAGFQTLGLCLSASVSTDLFLDSGTLWDYIVIPSNLGHSPG